MLMLAPGDISDRHHKAMNLAYRHDVFAKFMFHSKNRIFGKQKGLNCDGIIRLKACFLICFLINYSARPSRLER